MLKLAIGAQPYLHILLTESGYSIFVWDTRIVLHTSKDDYTNIEGEYVNDSFELTNDDFTNQLLTLCCYQMAKEVEDNIQGWYSDESTIHMASKIARKRKVKRPVILRVMRLRGTIVSCVWDEFGNVVPYERVFHGS